MSIPSFEGSLPDIGLRVPTHMIDFSTNEQVKLKKKLIDLTLPKLKDLNPLENPDLRLDMGKPNFMKILSSPEALTLPSPMADLTRALLKMQNFKVVNSAKGRIDHILLCVVLNIFKDFPQARAMLADAVKGIIDALGPNRRYTILCPQNEMEEIQGFFPEDAESEITFLNTVFSLTYWAQDAHIALQNELRQTALATSVSFNRYEDQTSSSDVCGQSNEIVTLPTNLYFQGGNVIITEETILLGKDYLVKNSGRAGVGDGSLKGVMEHISDYFGKQVVCVGLKNEINYEDRFEASPEGGKLVMYEGLYQPIFHIDIFVTFSGMRDPETEQEILFFGRPRKAMEILDAAGVEYNAEFNASSDKYFEEIQNTLANENNFKIVEMPLFSPDLVKIGKKHYRYFLTYNNVQLENYWDPETGKEVKSVILSQFGKKAKEMEGEEAAKALKVRETLNAAATEIWESHGFQVNHVHGMEFFAAYGGSIHCMTKVLYREEPEAPTQPNPKAIGSKPKPNFPFGKG